MSVGRQIASERLGREIVEAGIELFAAYGVHFERTQPCQGVDGTPTDGAFLGVCGFVGLQVSGTVVLETSESVLRGSNNTGSSSADWMAELANQFLGRIKNKLLRQGIAIQRIPPAVINSLAPSGCTGAPLIVLMSDQGSVSMWMYSESAIDQTEAAIPDTGVLAEGEMILF